VRAVANEIRRDAEAKSAETVKAITDVADSPTARASPRALADLIERETAASGEAVTHLYVDPAKASEVGAPVDPQALRDALAVGGKIEVPVAEYLERWAPAVGDALTEHVATRPGYMTAAEAKGQEAEVEAEAQALASEPVSEIPAVEAAVAQQAERMGLQALPQDVLGMEPEQYQAYLEEQARAKSTSARRAELAAKKEALREKEAWWREAEGKEREAADAEYEALPARKAALWLRGKVHDEDGTLVPVTVPKLDLAATREILGKEAARGVPTAKKGGMHPDDMAALVGYDSGRAMLEAVAALPEKDDWVRETAASRMAETHPSVLEDRERLRQEVSRGLHGEESSRWLLRELKALGAKAGAGRVRAEAIRRAAAIMVSRQPVGTINAHVALVRERGAANRKALAAARGEWGRALVYAQQQLLNMHLWRELDVARDEREAFLDLAAELRKPAARARLGKASPVYRDGVDMLLEALGLKDAELRDQPLPSVAQITAEMEADGTTVMFDPELVAGLLGRPRAWKELTLAEMREVEAALKNIRAAARTRGTALRDGRRVSLEEQAARLEAEAFANRKDRGPVSAAEDTDPTAEVGRAYGQAFDALNLRVETMANWLGGDSLESEWFRSIVLPMQEAKVRENDLLEKTVNPIVAAFDAMPKAVQRLAMQRVDGDALFPNHPSDEIEAPNRMVHLWMLWLFRGNDGGIERLASGRRITVEEIDASIVKYGTKEVMAWLQTVWDAAESLKEPAFALEERDSGVRPKEVRAVAISTPWGTYRGGYWPNAYDRRPAQPSAKQVGLSQGDLFDRTFIRPGTHHGYLKERVDTYDGILSASTSTVYQHLSQVAHDIAFRETVKSVGALLMQPNVDRALRRTLGEERAKQFMAWARRIGTMRGSDAAQHLSKLNRLIGEMRGNVAIAFLGYRPRIGLGDLANLPVSLTAAGVDPTYLSAALAELSRDAAVGVGGAIGPVRLKDWAFDRIGELRTMQNQWRREYVRVQRKLTKRRVPFLDETREHAFVFMETSFTATAVPIATAVYRKAKDAGASDRDAEIASAAALRRVFPSHSPVDQAALLADRGFWGWSALFMGYLNVIYQRQRHIVEPLLQADGFRQFAGRLPAASGSMLALIMTYGLFAEFLMGRGKEEDEEWADWAMRTSLTQSLAPVPFVNEAASLYAQYGLGRRPSPRNANPLLMVGEAWVEAAVAVGNEDEADRKFRAVARALGLSFGIPQDPFTAQGPYLFEVATGENSPENVFDVAGGLAYGNREAQPANPFSVLSDLVESR
jgi:hypothetical protein